MHAIKEFFIGDFENLPNHLVSFQRFFSLGLTIAVIIIAILIFRKKSYKQKRLFLTILGISVLVSEVITKLLRFFLNGDTNLIRLLVPMQFSSLVIIMMMITVFYRKDWFLKITTIAVLFAGIIYLIIPGAGMNETPIRMIAFNSIYTHSVDFIFGVFVVYFGMVKFEYKDIWKPFLFFIFCGLYAALLNLIIYPGSSYFYLSAPEYRELITFMPYEILLAFIVIAYILLLYFFDNLRYKCIEKHNKKQKT